MRSAAFLAFLFLLSAVCFAQVAAPPVASGVKAGPSTNPPSKEFLPNSPPILHSIDPTFGPAAGGTAVTLSGNLFTADATVDFGGTAAGDVVLVDKTTLTCTAPGHAAGVVDVTVTNGNGSDTLPDAFAYHGAPMLFSIDPTFGPAGGGTAVTLSGDLFTADATVDFGGTAAGDVVMVDKTTLTCTTPGHAAGLVDVTVTNLNGSDTLPGAFTFHGAPQIVSIDPDSGPEAGGTAVTLSGSGFTSIGTTSVTFDGTSATGILVVNTSTITCTTPAHAPAAVDVTVTNDFGSDTLAGGYVYNSPVIHVPGDYPTIQQALDAAASGDTVLVAPGIYVENLLFPARDIVVRSDFDGNSGTVDLAPSSTFIDGNQAGTVVTFLAASPSLIGFTVVNGYNPSFDFTAGGIYCADGASPTILYNIITGNLCDFGTGGLRSDASYSSHTIEGNIICGNVSLFGGSGGMMVEGTDASHTIEGNIIAGNRAVANSGGLSVTGINCSHAVLNNFIAANAGEIGGGLSLGGWESNQVTVTNNTIVDNHATQKGGGLAVGGWLVAEVTNTILWNNTAVTGNEISMNTAVFGTSELYLDHSDVDGGQAMVHVDPTCTLNWGAGMIDAPPECGSGPTGTWSSGGAYAAFAVTFIDTGATWTAGEFAGMLLNPDTAQELSFYIVANTANTITICADWDTIDAGASWVMAGSSYRIHDVHLAGTSPCIDQGDNFAPLLPAVDIDGDDRIMDGDGDLNPVVDMGADEVLP